MFILINQPWRWKFISESVQHPAPSSGLHVKHIPSGHEEADTSCVEEQRDHLFSFMSDSRSYSRTGLEHKPVEYSVEIITSPRSEFCCFLTEARIKRTDEAGTCKGHKTKPVFRCAVAMVVFPLLLKIKHVASFRSCRDAASLDRVRQTPLCAVEECRFSSLCQKANVSLIRGGTLWQVSVCAPVFKCISTSAKSTCSIMHIAISGRVAVQLSIFSDK